MFKVFKQYKQFSMASKRLSMANRAFSLENMDKKFEEILNGNLLQKLRLVIPLFLVIL